VKRTVNRKERSRRWVEAAITLANDPRLAVRCPECLSDYLNVMDVPWEDDPLHFERYMICKACGAWNMLRMRREDEI